jgi:hypothetical protein
MATFRQRGLPDLSRSPISSPPYRSEQRLDLWFVLFSSQQEGTGKFFNDRRHRRSTESGNLLAFEDQPKPVGDVVAMRQSGRRFINT